MHVSTFCEGVNKYPVSLIQYLIRHLFSVISQRLKETHQLDKGIATTTAESEIEKFCEL